MFEALQTISKRKQNKDIQKVDLDTFNLHFERSKLTKSAIFYRYYPNTEQ